jgi:hypothetical protein
LGYLDEVVHKNIGGFQGLVERTVGWWCNFVGLHRKSRDPRERLDNGVGFGFVGGSWPWIPGHLIVVLGRGFVVESVRRSDVVGSDGLGCKVTYCFGHDTEGRWRLGDWTHPMVQASGMVMS